MKRPRGRPRSFDEEVVKDAIMQVFWERGFAATSLDDLSRVTGLTRPSLYGAFGDKLSMYLLAMDVLTGTMRESAGQALWNGRTIKTALTKFFAKVLDIYLGDGETPPKGCLVFSTAIAEAVRHPEIKSALGRHNKSVEKAFRDRFADLCPGVSRATLSVMTSLAVSALHSLAIRARIGASRPELMALARQTIAAVEAVAEAK